MLHFFRSLKDKATDSKLFGGVPGLVDGTATLVPGATPRKLFNSKAGDPRLQFKVRAEF